MRLPTTTLCIIGMLLSAPAWAQARPWLGTWKLRAQDADGKPETLIYSDAGNGAMRMVSLEADSVIVTRFDGRPALDRGSGASKRHALAIRSLTSTSYSWTFLVAGKPVMRGRNTLAPDGHSFTEIASPVANPSQVFKLIYERQP